MPRTYFQLNSAGDKDISFYVNDIQFKIGGDGNVVGTGVTTAQKIQASKITSDYFTLGGITEVDATTPVLDMELGDCFELTMPDADKTIVFYNPRRSNIILRVKHNAVAHTLTFPTANWVGETGTSAKVYSLSAGATKYTIFNIFCNGVLAYGSDLTTGIGDLYPSRELIGATWGKAKATDDNATTTFIPSNILHEGGDWLAIDLGVAKYVNYVTVQGWLNMGSINYRAKDFQILGSNNSTDGSDGDWDLLYSATTVQNFDVQGFYIGNHGAYRWWKWYGVSTFSDANEYLGLCEWELKTASSGYYISDIPFQG